jgi:hypothetical protein
MRSGICAVNREIRSQYPSCMYQAVNDLQLGLSVDLMEGIGQALMLYIRHRLFSSHSGT